MSGYSASQKRARVYKRKFDWEDARRRRAAGASYDELAALYGVNKEAVRRVCLLPALPERLEEFRSSDSYERRHYNSCPICGRRKARVSTTCITCYGGTPFLPTTIETVPGSRHPNGARAKVVLAGIPNGRIVSINGSEAVVERGPSRHTRTLHFWDGPPEVMPDTTEVVLEPSIKVLVGGVEEEPEEIAA